MLRSVVLAAHVLSLLVIHIRTSIGQVSQVSQECSERGIQLNSSTGTIQSPNYPFLYPHNIKCIWNITVPARHVVRVTIVTLDISAIRNMYCNRAGFTAHDGPSPTSYIMMKACGKRSSFVIYSSTRHILLEFKSDSSRSTGFQADFTAVSDKPECSADVRRLSATNRKSDLVTPHFPALYPPNQMCTWMITAPANHVVMLRVLYFDMEASVSCKRDYFVVRDGAESTSPLLAKMCSQAKQCPLSSSGRYLWIQFKSNERWIFNGIRATYSAVRREVTNGGAGPVESLQDQGQLTASNSIAIENPVPTACIWNISVPHGMLVRITLDINVYGFAINCSAGYVDVFDGPRLSSPRIARHCSNALEQADLPQLTSSGRYVTVRLVLGSTGYGERVDLRASFKYIAKNTSGCSPSSITNVTSRNHVISSSYHPKYYPNNEDCKWRIVAPPGKIIQFRFVVCDVVYPGDYVDTRDGPTGFDKLIRPSTHPPKIGQYLTTTGRFLWVRFVSDQEKTASGFALDFNFIDKGD